ncbi:MAG TPA: chromosome segregation protein SMC [Terriglobales bacterium]|nr:chromosome segregation protein SMC [Terriglobales bacterium]
MSMIIKKLELQGFKSFAERTRIVFHPGITAVVGPNGTGKSNLVDAMLWVLGGHRQKTVRGDRTEDVIFNGNAKRPPLSMADAVLTLGGEDEELTVSHRVFRSGESEYRMNGKTVRLKDIMDELWKHAIGEKEYFVIEQGAIGDFVTSKPTEKRALIEEAAGTAFYKDKRKQAQSKLETTEQNLVRLEDIILEVEKARNSLQRQAQAANRYRRLRERIRELTSHHYQRKFTALERVQKEAGALHAEALAREHSIAARGREEDRALAARRKGLWDLEKSLKDTQERLYGLKSHIARLEGDAEREARRVEFFEEKRARSESDRDEVLADLLLLTQELEGTKARLDELGGAFERSRAEVDRSSGLLEEARAGKDSEEKGLEALRTSYLESLQDLTTTRNESVRAEKELEFLVRQEEKLVRELDEAGRELEGNAARAAALEGEVAGHLGARDASERRASELRAALDTARASQAAAQAELDGMKARRDEAAYHLQALRRIEEKERGDSAPGEVPGALGILADLIRTTPEDAPLFDVFWREEARARVVPAEEFLRGMPDGLKGSYLLVPAAERPAIPGDVLSRPEVLGLLKGRLEPHERMKDSLARLEDAVIVRSVGEAVRLWVGHPGLNFLTPSGDLLLASGLLKLGEKSGGIIALAAEARRFEDEAGRLEGALVPLAAGFEARSAEAAALEAELETERERLLGADRTLADRRKEHGFSRAEGEKIRANRDLLIRELEVLRSDKESLARTLDALRGRLDAGDSRLLALRATIEEKERALAGRQETVDASARSHFELRAGLDLLQEKMSGLRGQLEAAARRKEAAEAKINALESDARKSEEDKARLREDIAAFREKAKALRAEQAGAEAALAAAESSLEAVRGDVERLEAALRATREEEAAAKDERVRHEIRKAEVDRDLVNLDEMCWQELKKTLAELRAESEAASRAPAPAAPAPEAEAETEDLEEGAEDEAGEAPAETAATPGSTEAAAAGGIPAAPRPRRAAKKWRPLAEMSDEEVERELDESRESLNRYKAVNLMAEEEFLEQKTRYDFLVAQRQDLRDSIRSTEEAILKIDEESKAQFLKALEEVAKNFQELFTALFKGGNAEVKLLEPDNPLESGVEIVAQPPGKRVQNLNLLSGGEKSLTSMAFLFALFRYKPSPFCFLDEVDAALDDVNLMRFLDLLKAIKHQTQFVLITHNYKTMEVADYIYGTTMSEPNMTKLLSVKLERKGGGEVLNNPS